MVVSVSIVYNVLKWWFSACYYGIFTSCPIQIFPAVICVMSYWWKLVSLWSSFMFQTFFIIGVIQNIILGVKFGKLFNKIISEQPQNYYQCRTLLNCDPLTLRLEVAFMRKNEKLPFYLVLLYIHQCCNFSNRFWFMARTDKMREFYYSSFVKNLPRYINVSVRLIILYLSISRFRNPLCWSLYPYHHYYILFQSFWSYYQRNLWCTI